jgi:transcriptional regulator with XRE-family HTH domain
MKLQDYLKAKRISQARFARRVGMSRSGVSRLIAGNRYPSPETLRKVFLATDGEVKANDFYDQAMRQM